MGAEHEAGFPIEDFGGVNQNLDREKISSIELWSAQNMWEPTVGVLESRRGTEHFANPATLPDNIERLDQPMRVYRDGGDHARMIPAKVTPAVLHETSGDLPDGVTISLVNDSAGHWTRNKSYTADSVTANWSGQPEKILFRVVGYGLDAYYEVVYEAIPGYSASTAQKLRVEIATNLNNSLGTTNLVTGFEILAVVKHGTATTGSVTATFGGGGSEGDYHTQTMWVAFQELVTSATGAWDFLYVPVGYAGTSANIGVVNREFQYTIHSTGGTLKGGRTYYVMVMPQNIYPISGAPDLLLRRCRYMASGVDVNGGTIARIPLPPGGDTYRIQIDSISPATVCYIVAIGEHWQCMVPYKVYNDTANLPISITDYPRYSPSAIEFNATSSFSSSAFMFKYSPISVNDVNIGVEDDGSIYPVFNSRIHEVEIGIRFFVPFYDNFYRRPADSGSTFLPGFIQALTTSPSKMPRHGVKNTSFVQLENLLLSVSDEPPLPSEPSWLPLDPNSNYMVSDGNIKVPAAVLGFPPGISSAITYFDSSIVMGGSRPINERGNELGNFNSYQLVFSQALEPFDFRIPSTSVLQTVGIDYDHERIVGLGLYTNTATDLGPRSQLLVYKSNSIWVLDQLPGVEGVNLLPAQLGQLSGKVGSHSKYAVANTPLGTAFASYDNVYLIREDGEPTPIGQEISPILRRSDTQKIFVCYHDRQLKLSFYDPTVAGVNTKNNVEWWLDMNKMIEMKGLSSWTGPHIGRTIDYCFVEDRDGDGVISNLSRDRVCVDSTSKHITKADVIGLETDLDQPITSILETKDFPVSQQDNNWLKHLKRFYWKIRCVGPFNATDETWVDGVLKETKTISFEGDGVSAFDNQALKLFRYFPNGRQFGRVIRKRLTTTGKVGIGGFQINYQLIKRRM